MRRIALYWGLLALFLLLSGPLHAQMFHGRKYYERGKDYIRNHSLEMPVNKHLPMVSTPRSTPTMRIARTADGKFRSMGGHIEPASLYPQHYVAKQKAVPTGVPIVRAFGRSAWRGNVTNMSSGLAVPNASKRRIGSIGGGDEGIAGNPEDVVLGGIGGGDDGLAGNPEYVPIGNMPVWLLMLLIGAYACCLRRKVRTL